MHSNLPRLVVLEGVDAVGKTTIARMLESELGYTYFYTPQDPFAVVRKLVEEMQDINTRFFYYLTSVIGVQPQLRAMLAAGKRVAIDRYIYSTFAMHRVLGAQVKTVSMRSLPIAWPDVGVLLTARPEIRIARMDARAKQPTHDLRIERFVKEAEEAVLVYRTYRDLTPIDTSDLSTEEVFREVFNLLRRARC